MTAKCFVGALGFLAAVLTGCSLTLNSGLHKLAASDTRANPDNKDAIPAQPADPKGPPSTMPDSPKTNPPESLSLTGTWTSGCFAEKANTYRKETVVLTENSFTGTFFEYQNPECTAGTQGMKQRVLHKYIVGDALQSSSGASKIEYTDMKVFVTLMSDEMVTLFNSIFSPPTPWSKGVEQDATDFLSSDPNTKTEKIYSIFKLNGNTLCFGDSAGNSDDGLTEEKRHSKLDTGAACLTKQP